jgi:integrase
MRQINRLSSAKVNSIKEKGLYADGGGLYLQVAPGGSKSWVFRFKENGRAHDMGLGPTHTLSLAEARDKATECRKLRLQGVDPIVKRREDRAARAYEQAKAKTFQECAQEFMADNAIAWKNPKHRQQWQNTLTGYAYPVLGKLSVRDIDTGLVVKALKPLWTTIPETASRLRGRIETVLNWATAHGYRKDALGHAMPNPARWKGNLDHLLPRRDKVQAREHQPSLPHDRIGEFMQELRQQEGIAPLALQFTILTAARSGESLKAKWSEIDLSKKLWVIPAGRMKMGREHRVPLTEAAIAILKRMTAARQSDYVFPGRIAGKPLTDEAMTVVIRRMNSEGAGRPQYLDPRQNNRDVVPHGFRSTFKDWARERTSFANEISEAALAHVIADKAEAAYARGDMFEKRRRLMEAWAGCCAAPAVRGDVVSLVRA